MQNKKHVPSGGVLQLQRFPMLFSAKNYCFCIFALLQRLSLLNNELCKVIAIYDVMVDGILLGIYSKYNF